MQLRYYLNEHGKRVYTLEGTTKGEDEDAEDKPTFSAHPAAVLARRQVLGPADKVQEALQSAENARASAGPVKRAKQTRRQVLGPAD
eukprot:CAMPEP_0179246958 /NCGR_PEP_ID=MMETSP0797-20121207/19363_1 /TAXON_ID=47934 /ORGANISM="Dinophysis acuminata, Strain DAEP01" /LENGTH=86 /DNA_ID=CAMNT_0020954565 /DNA_START=102 /DNA_END=361 /DNA_ORIENTATION=-